MAELLLLAAAALLSVSGMAWLALAMEVHWGQVMRRPADQPAGSRQVLRALGAAALLLSLLACLAADHPSMAVLVWVMLMTAASVLVALVLGWRASLLRLLWPRTLMSRGKA